MSRLDELRQHYPTFRYSSYNWSISEAGLEIEYIYSLHPDYTFSHRLTIRDITQEEIDTTSGEALEKVIFSLGMAEMLSYWKLTCSPTVIIEAGTLSEDQARWWKHLLLHGMGEFFYVNDIDFSVQDFVTIVSQSIEDPLTPPRMTDNDNEHMEVRDEKSGVTSILIPIGGGKDSIVTIELLKQIKNLDYYALLINPTQASKDTLKISNISKSIFIDRKLDPQILEMNSQGFLNGHVPISSVIAFISVLVSIIKRIDAVAISNERSSNEGNIEFHGQMINHQYSKSYEFENRFQEYCKTYLNAQQLIKVPYYFSYLRPIYELQIGGAFAQFSAYHPAFRSCNRGQKTNTWCGNCPKCLFAYLILYPFMGHEYIVSIFGSDLFENENLKETALELVELGKNKPLECVGMYEESLIAFNMAIEKVTAAGKPLPVLLQLIKARALNKETNLTTRKQSLLASWNEEHGVPEILLEPLVKITNHIQKRYGE